MLITEFFSNCLSVIVLNHWTPFSDCPQSLNTFQWLLFKLFCHNQLKRCTVDHDKIHDLPLKPCNIKALQVANHQIFFPFLSYLLGDKNMQLWSSQLQITIILIIQVFQNSTNPNCFLLCTIRIMNSSSRIKD